MKISLLISTYNGMRDVPGLMKSIEGLAREGCELEVLVRDDGSVDGTGDYIKANYPWVRVIGSTGNLGFARSNNALFESSTGDVICLVNQDTVLHRDFIVEGLAALADEGVGAVNSNMIMPWVMGLAEFQGGAEVPCYEYQLTVEGYTRYVQVDCASRMTNFITGGGCFIKRRALGSGPLFDPNIHMYCEDTDLSLRLIKAGWRIAYAPRAIIYHNQQPKPLRPMAAMRKLFNITRVRMYVLRKHDGVGRFLLNYPRYLVGIVTKMGHLGLREPSLLAAYASGAVMAVVFLLGLPCVLIFQKKP